MMSRYERSDSDAPPGRPTARKRRSRNRTFATLLSCCLFLTVVCGCLLAALVLIGKNVVFNATTPRSITSAVPTTARRSILRLPRDAIPLVYDIRLEPNLDDGIFRGAVNITLNVTGYRKEFLVHSKNLSVEAVDLVRLNDSKTFPIGNVHESTIDELLVIVPKERIFPGMYALNIVFNGNMLDKTVGLYRSRYKHANDSKQRYMATSKFEPTYARQAFPCFDEPNLKATYKVHLLKPKDSNYIALSNYPQYKEETVENGVMVHFNETVPMSTYLACFIVSDFTYTETYFDNNGTQIPFRVYATPQQLNKTEYAGTVGKSVIEYYIDYFQIPFPLPKLDMVAIPDFVSGAMEHWGLVTFRETALLYTNTTHSSSNKQRVATVVAHELAHSWFGNLVTMNWWNDLWLNEGFASYIEYKGTDHAEPTWGMMDQFLIADLHSVLSLDATQSSHPIIKTVITPDEITAVFDTISYNKGAAILRMLENTVGNDNFQKGITNYLKKHKFNNAITQDLWNELQEVVGDSINITNFMNTFTIQMGYPIVTIISEGNKYVLKQKRFLKDYNSAKTYSPLGYKWSIPLKYITDVGKSDIIWLDYTSEQITIEKPAEANWIKFNPEQIGYYRVNYPETEWKKLISNITSLSISDRAHLIEESFAIAESGELNYTIPLELTQYLIDELDYVPWSVASSKLSSIKTYLQNTEYESEFKEFVIRLIKPAYENFTWKDDDENEGHLKKLARVVVLNLACSVNYDDALTKASEEFDKWITKNGTLSQDLRSIIYKYGMVNAKEDTWNKLFDTFNAENDANEKLKLMNGLASVKNPSLLSRFIDLAKDETYVRSQDYFTLLQYISANPIGTPIVWDYVREHWLNLVKRFTLNDRYLGSLLPAITKTFSTTTKLEEVQQFFAKYPDAGAGASSRKQALETIQNNIKWVANYKEIIGQWIKA